MNKEELIASVRVRIEECVRNAYNLGEKNSREGYDRGYEDGFEAAKCKTTAVSAAEMDNVYKNGVSLGWSLAGSLAYTSKADRIKLFGYKRISEIIEHYTPEMAAEKLQTVWKGKANPPLN